VCEFFHHTAGGMADANATLKSAMEVVNQAITADNEQQYEKALSLYKRALEIFVVVLKWEKNPKTKETVGARVKSYMDRAEVIQKLLKEQEAQPPAAPAAAGGKKKAVAGACFACNNNPLTRPPRRRR
jgi:vacuolar protein-sorting-associated protein 4